MSNAKYALIIAGLLAAIAALVITFRNGVAAPLSTKEHAWIWGLLALGFSLVFITLSMA